MARLRIITSEPAPVKRTKPPRDYRAWLAATRKAKGIKTKPIERTSKRADEYEFNHRGQLVACRRTDHEES